MLTKFYDIKQGAGLSEKMFSFRRCFEITAVVGDKPCTILSGDKIIAGTLLVWSVRNFKIIAEERQSFFDDRGILMTEAV